MCAEVLCSDHVPKVLQFPFLYSGYQFLANVNSSSRSLYAVACPSVVCLSVTLLQHPTQAVVIFGNISTDLDHPFTFTENFTEIVPGEPLRRGVKHKRGSQVYSDFHLCINHLPRRECV